MSYMYSIILISAIQNQILILYSYVWYHYALRVCFFSAECQSVNLQVHLPMGMDIISFKVFWENLQPAP